MKAETYYTIRSHHSPCGSRSEVLFELTYRRVWRPELSDDGQWCDFLVDQKEVETGQVSAHALHTDLIASEVRQQLSVGNRA